MKAFDVIKHISIRTEAPNFKIGWAVAVVAPLLLFPFWWRLDVAAWGVPLAILIGTVLFVVSVLFEIDFVSLASSFKPQTKKVLGEQAGFLVINTTGRCPVPVPTIQQQSEDVEFCGFKNLQGEVIFFVDPTDRSQSQLEFGVLAKSIKKARAPKALPVAIEIDNQKVYAIDCERFVALMLDRMAVDANKAAEQALQHGMQKYVSDSKISTEAWNFLTDATVMELVKNDFRGSMSFVITRTGEKVIKEMLRKAKEQEHSSQRKHTLKILES